MANVFVISDTHFHHAGILTFTHDDGLHLRPEFNSVEEMDEYMVERWNSVVRDGDHVWHLGDVVMRPNTEKLKILARLQGHKRLLLGNHDSDRMNLYRPYFEKIAGIHMIDHLLLSHVPVHPDSLSKATHNVHGHVHNNVPPLFYGPRYFNVSVEAIGYTPVSLEDLKLRIKKQEEEYDNAR